MRRLLIRIEIIWYRIIHHFFKIPLSTKEIPEGLYCYTMLSKPGTMENGKWGYKIKPCKYYRYIHEHQKACLFENFVGFDPCLHDQCKICEQKIGMYDDD